MRLTPHAFLLSAARPCEHNRLPMRIHYADRTLARSVTMRRHTGNDVGIFSMFKRKDDQADSDAAPDTRLRAGEPSRLPLDTDAERARQREIARATAAKIDAIESAMADDIFNTPEPAWGSGAAPSAPTSSPAGARRRHPADAGNGHHRTAGRRRAARRRRSRPRPRRWSRKSPSCTPTARRRWPNRCCATAWPTSGQHRPHGVVDAVRPVPGRRPPARLRQPRDRLRQPASKPRRRPGTRCCRPPRPARPTPA